MKKTLLALALAAGLSASSQAAVSYQSVTNGVTALGTTFNFNKFNSSLGTLNSITFSILSSVDSGSFSVQNNSASAFRVKNTSDSLFVFDNQSSGADYTSGTISLVTTPDTTFPGYLLASNASQSFAITSKSLIGTGPVTIDLSGFFAAYTGSGLVSFDAAISPTVSVGTGGTPNFDGVLNTTAMSLTYDYTAAPAPVPEPGQVAASMLLIGGIVGFVIVRRRKAALVA